MLSFASRAAVVRRAVTTTALTATALFGAAAAQAQQAQQPLPTGGTVASGTATIDSTATSQTVTQTSSKAIINYTSFDVAQGNTVAFNQGSDLSATLARVTGSVASTVAGRVTSQGRLYLVNPNGISITSTGIVQATGGFVASTLNITDANFNSGANINATTHSFTGNRASAAVSNAGSIEGSPLVALLGGTVSNTGYISVQSGTAALGSGEAITLDFSGANFLQVVVPTASVTANGAALIESAGSISGSRILLSGASAADAIRNIVNVTGTLNADNASGSGGTITLTTTDGGGGNTAVSGTLTARGGGAGSSGGTITLRGGTLTTTGLVASTSSANGNAGTLTLQQYGDYTPMPVGGLLADNNVTVSSAFGSVTLADATSWTTGNTLTLAASRAITLGGAITATSGGLSLNAGIGRPITPAAIDVGTLSLMSGNWTQVGANLPSLRAIDFRLQISSGAEFLRATGGDGSAATPYRIADVYGLQGIASSSLLGSNFALANAIDASGTAAWNGGLGFLPIGTRDAVSTVGSGFTGSLDGANPAGGTFAISGLRITRSTAGSVAAMFGVVSGAAAFRNVALSGVNIRGVGPTGGLLGRVATGQTVALSNVTVSGSVSGTSTSALVGGVAGQFSSGTITGSTSTATVSGLSTTGGLVGLLGGRVTSSSAGGTVTNSDAGSTGGLVGSMTSTAAISASSASGVVGSTGSTATAGGIGGLVGLQQGGSIATSTATGAVSGTRNVGGLVGLLSVASGAGYSATIANSSATGTVSGTANGGVVMGGLVGSVAQNSTNASSSVSITGSFATGNVQGTTAASGSGLGGLVGQTGADASRPILITNSYATGTVSGISNIGGLIGSASGTSLNGTFATGAVTGPASGNVLSLGGLVGNLVNRSSIVASYATGAVTTAAANAIQIGGLVGTTSGTGNTLRDVYASGSVTAASGNSVGGLVGLTNNNGTSDTITFAYATGAVTGRINVGGLVGLSNAGNPVRSVYASGAVVGSSAVGGLIGTNHGSLSVAYWDSFSTGQGVAVGSGSGGVASTSAITSDPAQAASRIYAFSRPAYENFAAATGIGTANASGFVFAPGNSTRAMLAFEVPVAGNPLVTNNAGVLSLTGAHQLQLVNGYYAAYNGAIDGATLTRSYALARNIDLAETGANQGTASTSAGMWAATGFVPLGSNGSGALWNGTAFSQVGYADVGKAGAATGFAGSFNGAGFTLSNLGVNRAGVQNVGLFGGSSGTISNLTLTGSVTGYVSTGGLVGLQQGGSISGVTSQVAVTGSSGAAYVGGLVGFASNASIASSSASGAVSASGAAGGLVGLLVNSTLSSSSASGAVTGRNGKSGGLVGIVEGATVTGGTSTGSVNGTANGRGYGTLRDGGTYNGVGEQQP